MKQRGYSLVDFMIASVVVAGIAVAGFQVSMEKANDSTFDTAIADMTAIGRTAEVYARQVTSSSIDANGVYQYSYRTQPTFTTVDALNTASNANLPLKSPYGTSYEWMVGNGPAVVRFLLPTGLDAAGRQDVGISRIGSNTYATLSVLRPPRGSKLSMLGDEKQIIYQEPIR